jgi:regulator of protease activity HflC (stomatin/prohibitin superfamily)
LRQQIDQQLLTTYGVRVAQVGIERLTLPSVTLTATVDRMRAERETIATERTAIGKREAAQIRSAAERDARIVQADATVKAADIEAQSRVEAAQIYGRAYAGIPSCTTCCAPRHPGHRGHPGTKIICAPTPRRSACWWWTAEGHPAMTERDRPDIRWIQAGRLTFMALYAVTVLAALAWAFSNVRQIDPQNRAVVLHFGALDRVQNAGLLLAWPQPFEQVVLLPAADRVIERRVENLLRSGGEPG